MALPSVLPSSTPPVPSALTIDGLLVAAVELQKFPSDYQPFRRLWLFRSQSGWTLLTFVRHERWLDDGRADIERCAARAVVESFAGVDDLAGSIRSRYGDLGWTELLDAAAVEDAEMFRIWAPIALERELTRATFHRPDLISEGSFTSSALDDLADELIAHLENAGYNVTDIEMARRANPWTERNRIAIGSVRRYGCEADIVVRIDAEGEIYVRVDDRDGRAAIRRVEFDDE